MSGECGRGEWMWDTVFLKSTVHLDYSNQPVEAIERRVVDDATEERQPCSWQRGIGERMESLSAVLIEQYARDDVILSGFAMPIQICRYFMQNYSNPTVAHP